jgi:hypothetical protein
MAARASERPKVAAITVERTPAGIRARVWSPSGVARFWKPLEEDVLVDEAALTRWVSSVDSRHGPGAAILVSPELRAEEGLMDALKRGMK